MKIRTDFVINLRRGGFIVVRKEQFSSNIKILPCTFCRKGIKENENWINHRNADLGKQEDTAKERMKIVWKKKWKKKQLAEWTF